MGYKTIRIWVKDRVILKDKQYTVEGKPFTANLEPFNDAFFTILTGKHKGNLIHVFNVK